MKAIDLFAGAGGFSTGARMAGAQVVWAANHWPAAVAALPVAAGQRLGTLVVTDGSRIVARSPLLAARAEAAPDLPAKGWWVARRTVHHLGGALP